MHLKIKYTIAAAIPLLLGSVIFSQTSVSENTGTINDIVAMTEDAYGLDQQLVNGVFFENVYRGAKGHPYMFADAFVEGSLIFRDKAYDKVLMKYDLYAQQILISHPHEDIAMTSILTDDFVSSFDAYGMEFKKLSFPGEAPTYYQVILEEEMLGCYIHWFKIRNETIDDNSTRLYLFAGEKRRFYLYINEEAQWFLNNWTFSRLFPKDAKREVKRYLRTNNLKVQRASDNELRQLIVECNSILLNTKAGIE